MCAFLCILFVFIGVGVKGSRDLDVTLISKEYIFRLYEVSLKCGLVNKCLGKQNNANETGHFHL